MCNMEFVQSLSYWKYACALWLCWTWWNVTGQLLCVLNRPIHSAQVGLHTKTDIQLTKSKKKEKEKNKILQKLALIMVKTFSTCICMSTHSIKVLVQVHKHLRSRSIRYQVTRQKHKVYICNTYNSKEIKCFVTLTVRHCIISERLVSVAAPWFDSTASEM